MPISAANGVTFWNDGGSAYDSAAAVIGDMVNALPVCTRTHSQCARDKVPNNQAMRTMNQTASEMAEMERPHSHVMECSGSVHCGSGAKAAAQPLLQ